jgi:Uma2 family endonuclease
MSAVSSKTGYKPEDLLTMPDADRYELVDGTLVERNMGIESSWIGGEIYGWLRDFARLNQRGWVIPADGSYQCFPHAPQRVRRPDVSFIRFGRLPGERLPEGHALITPDLAVEVISPNDLYEEIDAKVEEYLQAGVQTVWVVNPRTRTVQVHRADGSVTKLRESDELTGEGPLAGFRCALRDLFPPAKPRIEAE